MKQIAVVLGLTGIVLMVGALTTGISHAQQSPTPTLVPEDPAAEPIATALLVTPTPSPEGFASPTPLSFITPLPSPTVPSTATPTPTVVVRIVGTAFTGPTLTPTAIPIVARVVVRSGFVRTNPERDAAPTASVFEDDVLDVIGRNADGTWLQVARTYRDEPIGWVSTQLITFDFSPEELPLTDFTTGVTGAALLTEPIDYAVFVNDEVVLRTLPDTDQGERIGTVPASSVVPTLARYGNGEWLLVNYLGTEGWIAGFATRPRPDILTLTELTGLLGENLIGNVVVIAPEVQLAQIERARAFVEPRHEVAHDLVNFWWLVDQGIVLPCAPPPTTVSGYRYGPRDVIELPELDRYIPRLNQGVTLLNASIDALDGCGVMDPFDVVEARNDAINASSILGGTALALDNLEQIIR